MRGAQAALSPNLGAPAAPVLWQAVQVVSKTDLPSMGFAAAAGAAAAAASAGAAAAGAEPGACCGTTSGSAGGVFAFISFTHAAYSASLFASTTIGMKPCSLPQIW